MPALLFISLYLTFSISVHASKNTFIVLVDPTARPYPFPTHHTWYTSLLLSSSSSSSTSNNTSPFIHLYETLFHGFSATLTTYQSTQLNQTHGILGIFPDTVLHLHTTRSPAFLGLDQPNSRLCSISNYGSDVIIGIIDTGIWPERESFSDHHLGPLPRRWRGECEHGPMFKKSNCNKKLIGARYFVSGYEASSIGLLNETVEFRSPRDSDGHGTHVASIAAGFPVTGANFEGFADGIAKGMAARARIAVYKVCWRSGCLLSDVCSAFDKAVLDGVDIISVSLGSSSAPFYLDLLAVAAFRASQKRVLDVASAANEGPHPASVTNATPWILTVGAGTIDRDFPALVMLGNGKIIRGTSLAPQTRFPRNPYPLSTSCNRTESVTGKIVFCMGDRHVPRIDLGNSLKYGGAVAMIISHGEFDPMGIVAEPHVIPAIAIGVSAAKFIGEYIRNGDHDPTAMIFSEGTELVHVKPAPMVASFSSRGPNLAVPRLLKPDLLAPGVNILGAWTDAIAPSSVKTDIRRSKFNVMSGTSMACPHVSGVAALIKGARPDMSPGDIKSALMTTASPCRNSSVSPLISDEFSSNPASPFDIGSGHLQPERALDPGLVYDLSSQDYFEFLCGLNYTPKQIQIITGNRVVCTGNEKGDLNYPAFVAIAEEVVSSGEAVFSRRLKMVSEGPGVYRAKVVGPNEYKIYVEPDILLFGSIGERLEFRLVVKVKGRRVGKRRDSGLSVGVLKWMDEGGNHVVRSPIVVFSSSLQRTV